MGILKVEPHARSQEQIDSMLHFLSDLTIFEREKPSLPLLSSLLVETFRKETTLLEISSIQDIQNQQYFYFILTGNVTVLRGDQVAVYTIPASHTFGEVIISKSLLILNSTQKISSSDGSLSAHSASSTYRNSSIPNRQTQKWQFRTSQAEETVVLKIPLHVYTQELQQRWEKDLETRCTFLKRCHVPIFTRMDYALLLELAKQMRKHKLRARTVLCKQDTFAASMYFLVSGECKVLKHLLFEEAQGREHRQYVKFLELATFKPREYFGELVLLNYDISMQNPPKRACSVFTVSNEVEILALHYHTFSIFFTEWMISVMKEYADGYPDVAEISHLFVKRTRWQQYKNSLVEKLSDSKSNVR